MKFKKPIIFFDLETTGVDTMVDKIVQIATIKIDPKGHKEEKSYLVNPEMPIPVGASAVHGITDDMVKDSPTFSKYAKGLSEYLQGCDIGGYNSNNYDIPLLLEEFSRVGVELDMSETNFVDVLAIERQLNPNTLSAVYERYMGQPLEDAHDALIDVKATVSILEQQIALHKIKSDASALDAFSQGENKRVDIAGKLCEIDGEVCWTFGKYRHQPLKNDLSYVSWFLKQPIPTQTKKIINKLFNN